MVVFYILGGLCNDIDWARCSAITGNTVDTSSFAKELDRTVEERFPFSDNREFSNNDLKYLNKLIDNTYMYTKCWNFRLYYFRDTQGIIKIHKNSASRKPEAIRYQYNRYHYSTQLLSNNTHKSFPTVIYKPEAMICNNLGRLINTHL